jgi:hypothetical protein
LAAEVGATGEGTAFAAGFADQVTTADLAIFDDSGLWFAKAVGCFFRGKQDTLLSRFASCELLGVTDIGTTLDGGVSFDRSAVQVKFAVGILTASQTSRFASAFGATVPARLS